MKTTQSAPGAGEMLREGLRATLADRRGLLIYGLPAGLLLAGTWTLFALDGTARSSAVNFGLEFVLAIVAFRWQRRYLLGPGSENTAVSSDQRSIARLLFAYVFRAGLLYIVLAIATMGLTIPIVQTLAASDNTGLIMAVAIAALSALTLIAARFFLVFPSIAAGHVLRWTESAALASDRPMSLAFAIIASYLPILIVALIFLALPEAFRDSTPGTVLLNVVLAAARIGGMFVALLAVAHCFRCVVTAPGRAALD
ncbi:MAG: hypothetical protein GDA49_12980 [Rhodospirillales bacterium]|nr:hypothetical protein [Rhodospirillales bacterium]